MWWEWGAHRLYLLLRERHFPARYVGSDGYYLQK